ncbi:hypothetical protein AO260_21435 [Pseudomonas sp. ABAC21]|nr:hypothetical protein AO260_21435 [Pseudomonas sp. ABAC21]
MTFDKDQLRKTAELQKLMRDPAAVLALIAERDQLKAYNEALRGLYQMHKQTETREMGDLKLENERLRKECARLTEDNLALLENPGDAL